MVPRRRKMCDCGSLENASKEPDHAIRFDAQMKEYYIAYGTGSRMMVYYCPHCGGKIPESRRPSLFAHVTEKESMRIVRLLKGIRTVEDVLAKFGPPDEEREQNSSVRHPEREGKPETGEWFLRTMVYKNLSPVANVKFAVGAGGSVHPSWSGKSIGGKEADTASD